MCGDIKCEWERERARRESVRASSERVRIKGKSERQASCRV